MKANENKFLVRDGDMSSLITTSQEKVYYLVGFSFHLFWTGNATGQFKIQITNDLTAPWNDIEESVYSPTPGQNILTYNVTVVFYKFVRLVWTPTSGTGILQGHFIGKGN